MKAAGLALLSAVVAPALAGAASTDTSPAAESQIWFDDLRGVGPLPVAGEPSAGEVPRALARHLVDLALRRTGGPGALPAGLAEDREPRMIFLSLGDGVARARVLRAADRGVAATVERLRGELRNLPDGFTPRVVRVDLVTDVERLEVEPDRPSPHPRSLYGLAFERDLGLAFLADEVVTHTLIDSDQKLRLGNVRKRPEAAAVREKLTRLASSRRVPLFRFAGDAFVSVDGGEPVTLYRGHRRDDEITPDELLRRAVLGGRYLTRAVGADGRFVYSYLPKTDRTKDGYNALRHCGTTYAMLELYRVTRDPDLLAAAERALGYLVRELLGRCRAGDLETACVVEDGEVKLGGNALAIVALAQHAEVTGGSEHGGLIADLGRWILAAQADDGEFTLHKQSHPGGEPSDFVSGYYPGEALLALVRGAAIGRDRPDPAWLDAAERGARWLIEIRDRDLPPAALNHDHWLLYALGELHRLRPSHLYLEHAARITDAILRRQRQRDPDFPDWLGSYYRPPRSTPTATRSEGLAAAWRMFQAAGDDTRAAAVLAALELGVGFQLRTQFLPETVLYLDDPERAVGGFHRSLTDYEIRIDYVQHNVSALLLLRSILLERAAESGDRGPHR